MVSPVLILHAPGVADGGEAWRSAFEASVFGVVSVPDLPGHAGQPLRAGGNYTIMDPAFEAGRLIAAGLDLSGATIVGVGVSGWSAQILAIAGHGARLVLVDGLGAPWLSTDQRTLMRRERLRRVAVDPAAHEPYGGTDVDPRLGHGSDNHGDLALALEAAALLTIPTLVMEAEAAASADLIAAFPTGSHHIVGATGPADVARSLAVWLR